MVLYLAVRCNTNPEHIIPLKLIATGDDLRDVATSPFDAECSFCGTTQRYYARQVEEWMRPQPIEIFQTHPSFL
jgi:hypothetical protein